MPSVIYTGYSLYVVFSVKAQDVVFGVGETKDRGASAGAMPHAPTLRVLQLLLSPRIVVYSSQLIPFIFI